MIHWTRVPGLATNIGSSSMVAPHPPGLLFVTTGIWHCSCSFGQTFAFFKGTGLNFATSTSWPLSADADWACAPYAAGASFRASWAVQAVKTIARTSTPWILFFIVRSLRVDRGGKD